MKVFDEEFVNCFRNKFSVGKKGFRRGFGSVMGFLTDQFDERVIENFLERGDAKYLILNALGKKSMHGYQIISDIEKDFQGLYSPSPGSVYPTLQMLDESGLISLEKKDSKKIYSLTKKGKKILEENKNRIKEIFSRVSEHREKHWFGREMRVLSSKYAGLGSEVFLKAKKFSSDKSAENKLKSIEKVLDSARDEIIRIWSSS